MRLVAALDTKSHATNVMGKVGISMAVPIIDGNMDDDQMNSDISESIDCYSKLPINRIE